ncbi:MAG: hypothetical protein KIS86_08970 [Devosia sp.]|nr:hypothetical protein [Devosia sp.]
MKALLTAMAVLALSTVAFAQDIAGRYSLEGGNPGSSGRYGGEVEVTASGDTYQVIWRIGGQTQEGTGVLVGEVFSVAWQQKGAAPGIAVYERGGDGTLSGVWAPMGSSALGIEVWTPDGGI